MKTCAPASDDGAASIGFGSIGGLFVGVPSSVMPLNLAKCARSWLIQAALATKQRSELN
jgi:hypothetical protein